MDLVVVDLWGSFQMRSGWQEKLLSDGLHLTPEGNAAVFEELSAVLRKDHRLLHLDPDGLAMDGPNHRDIDPSNPSAAFQVHV